ncbi:MAG: peptidyl-tRNA hydrolase Pth2 [Candidatus Heimdallarchaeota archaeon]|nr:MAG: peptidyl-tRNA hydrolase [Candidatus Gerdarchaeota archaeon]RLI70383.1 MAG: peptidyl-tRNA hydrolase [Candidatus Heimdallarchaeota archaeon]
MSSHNSDFQYKMVIGIRKDLQMSKGKTAVQTAHAAVLAVEDAKRRHKDWLKKWFYEGQKKVVVQLSSEEELHHLLQKARATNLPYAVVNDAGLTELPPNTTTAIALGPAPNDKLDKLTSKYKLL